MKRRSEFAEPCFFQPACAISGWRLILPNQKACSLPVIRALAVFSRPPFLSREPLLATSFPDTGALLVWQMPTLIGRASALAESGVRRSEETRFKETRFEETTGRIGLAGGAGPLPHGALSLTHKFEAGSGSGARAPGGNSLQMSARFPQAEDRRSPRHVGGDFAPLRSGLGRDRSAGNTATSEGKFSS